ncbi:T9SS type A sorting domain-containing protein [Bacteroidales bacterium AH-315-I05]|nr:T9SS type A sorting domain-containing protein [Bacteroidales bacterium AH-315-I05]
MKRKSYLAMIAFLFGASVVFGQSVPDQRNCYTMENLEAMKAKYPDLVKNMAKAENRAKLWREKNQQKSGVVITIPVVVHVIYNTNSQNISDAQVQSQIDVLNEDFRKLNTDASNAPGGFAALVADSEIEFCLAQRDPQGNATTGIVRVQTSQTSFSGGSDMKFTAQGGSDAWPASDYLNIWSVNFGGGLLGFAQFPGGNSSTDGVVIGYNYFGDQGVVSPPFHKGRTSTHEIGHWLGLRHIWGDSNCGNDQVADTPPQSGASSGCPSYPRTSNCTGNGADGDMFMNYMDYTNDACMYMFSIGQGNVMNSVLNTTRVSLKNSNGCVPVNLANDDGGITLVNSPNGTFCADDFTPQVELKNWGANTLTSVIINYQLDGGTVMTQAWTGSLVSLATTTVTLTTIGVSPGSHTFTVFTSNPNGTTDGDTSNDSQTSNFTTTSQTAGTAPPIVEGFEQVTTFPPTGWSLDNSDGGITWTISTAAAATGSTSIKMDNFNYNAPGEIDEFVLPDVDLSNASAVTLTFQLAYALYTELGQGQDFSDTLEVLASTDCGQTWTELYKKFDQALTTTTPYFTTADFVPTASEWRKETVDLSQFSGNNSVQVKFKHITDYENNMYLDDINIATTVGVEEKLAVDAISIYPNPTNGEFEIRSSKYEAENASLFVYNILGEIVYEKHEIQNSKLKVDLSDKEAGVYFIMLKTGNEVAVKKVNLLK